MSILEQIKDFNQDSLIILNDGRRVKLSDITGVVNPDVSLSDINDRIRSVIKFRTEELTITDTLSLLNSSDKVQYSYVSQNDSSSDKLIRNNSRMIYQNLILGEGRIKITLVHLGDFIYLLEPYEPLRSISAFIDNKRAIPDLLGLSIDKQIWFSQLDEDSKEKILNTKVIIKHVSSEDTHDRDYINLVQRLYGISQSVIACIRN